MPADGVFTGVAFSFCLFFFLNLRIALMLSVIPKRSGLGMGGLKAMTG